MKLPQAAGRGGWGVNMTPMIDVVFLLIIFFLVSSHLARRENELQLALPAASSGDLEKDDTQRRLTINIRSDGSLSLAGRPMGDDDLVSRLEAARQQEGSEMELRIRADRHVIYEHVSPVLRAAATSGIWNVTFAVIREELPR